MPKELKLEEKKSLVGTWFHEAAKLLVQEGLTLRQAVMRLELPVTTDQCEQIYKSAPFQRILRAEQNRHNREIALAPGRDKTSMIGLMLKLVDKLIDSEEFDKAANVLEKAMKAEGYLNQEGQQNIFLGLTPKDFAQLRQEIEAQKEIKPN